MVILATEHTILRLLKRQAKKTGTQKCRQWIHELLLLTLFHKKCESMLSYLLYVRGHIDQLSFLPINRNISPVLFSISREFFRCFYIAHLNMHSLLQGRTSALSPHLRWILLYSVRRSDYGKMYSYRRWTARSAMSSIPISIEFGQPKCPAEQKQKRHKIIFLLADARCREYCHRCDVRWSKMSVRTIPSLDCVHQSTNVRHIKRTPTVMILVNGMYCSV